MINKERFIILRQQWSLSPERVGNSLQFNWDISMRQLLRLYSYFQLKGGYKTRRNIEWLCDIMNSKHVIRFALRGHHVHTIRRCYSSLSQSRNIIVMLIIIYRPRYRVIKFTATCLGRLTIAILKNFFSFCFFKLLTNF